MKKALIYLVLGTSISFLLNYLFFDSSHHWIDFYYAFAFGFAWGMAYFLDTPEYRLPVKLGISMVGIMVMVAIGAVIFDLKTALPSVMKFATVFVAYYLIASFRESKSLRRDS